MADQQNISQLNTLAEYIYGDSAQKVSSILSDVEYISSDAKQNISNLVTQIEFTEVPAKEGFLGKILFKDDSPSKVSGFTGNINLNDSVLLKKGSFTGNILLENNSKKSSFIGSVDLIQDSLYLSIDSYESITDSLYIEFYGSCPASATLTVDNEIGTISRVANTWSYSARLVPYQYNKFIFTATDNAGNILTETAIVYCDFKCGFTLDSQPSLILVKDLTTDYEVEILNNKIIYDKTVKPILTSLVEDGLNIKYGDYDSLYLEPDAVIYTTKTLNIFSKLNDYLTIVDITNNYIYHVVYDVLTTSLQDTEVIKKVIITGPISWLYNERINTCEKTSYYDATIDENKYTLKV